jgi:hypothetical protein
MNELDNVMSLKTLVSVMGGISNSYKQFVSEYPKEYVDRLRFFNFEKELLKKIDFYYQNFLEQIDKAYSDFKN